MVHYSGVEILAVLLGGGLVCFFSSLLNLSCRFLYFLSIILLIDFWIVSWMEGHRFLHSWAALRFAWYKSLFILLFFFPLYTNLIFAI